MRLILTLLFLGVVACGDDDGATDATVERDAEVDAPNDTRSDVSVSDATADTNAIDDAGADSGPLPEWQLEPDQFVPARMPMTVVHPRPDTETNDWARHRKAYPGLAYTIPIGVQGGAWPFLYEIVNGPPGAHIGRVHGESDYGVFTWTAAEAGTFEVEVRITDQELNVASATWTLEVDADAFVFLDAMRGSDANPGTLASPLQTFAGMYRDDEMDTSFAGKILVVREGNYMLVGDPDRNGNTRIRSDRKPLVWINYPGEAPVFNASTSKIFAEAPREDLYIAGIRFEEARTDAANSHFFWVTNGGDRITFFRNTFYDLEPGTAGNDNAGAVFISGSPSSPIKRYILAKQNTYDEINSGGLNGHLFEFYRTQYVLLEEETARNTDSGAGWFAKGAVSHTTMRNNRAVEGIERAFTGSYGAESGAEPPGDFEYCWNEARANTPFFFSTSNRYRGMGYNTSVYRNTFRGNIVVRFEGRDDYRFDGNIIVGDTSRMNSDLIVNEHSDDLIGEEADGILDSENALTDEYASYRGSHGHVPAR